MSDTSTGGYGDRDLSVSLAFSQCLKPLLDGIRGIYAVNGFTRLQLERKHSTQV